MSVGLYNAKEGIWLADYLIDTDGHRPIFTTDPAQAKRFASAESARDWKRDDMVKGLGTPKKLPGA